MNNAADYLAHIQALIIDNPAVTHWSVVWEEAQGNLGLFRYRLTLTDGSLLEMFERFNVREDTVQVTKYSFHWQDASGQLRQRWDNAPHHPELATHPHHVHEGQEEAAEPHEPITAEEALDLVTRAVADVESHKVIPGKVS